MTLFEYLAIASSLVFSFTAMRFVGGLSHAFDAERRYWPHLCFVFAGLLGTMGTFWAFWSYRDADWTFLRFLLALADPCMLYFLACTLVPEAPGSVESWRTYYYSVRKRYFLGLTFWSLSAATSVTVLLGTPVMHPARAVEVAFLSIAIVGVASDSPRVHAGIAGLNAAVVVVSEAVLLPGGLA